jgi:CMP-N-acetylneuraminic acid synthetase
MARAGSQRFKNKNLAEFGPAQLATTLLQWKIEQLLEVFPREKIILSSDSSDYLDLGSNYKITLHSREKDVRTYQAL